MEKLNIKMENGKTRGKREKQQITRIARMAFLFSYSTIQQFNDSTMIRRI